MDKQENNAHSVELIPLSTKRAVRSAVLVATRNAELSTVDVNTLKEKLFWWHPWFKVWIESTSLFQAIVMGTRDSKSFPPIERSVEYIQNGESFRLTFNTDIEIKKAEDLPIEIIQKFYENSPYYYSPENQAEL